MGGEEGLRFRKSPELAAYSAAYSPEKVRVQKLFVQQIFPKKVRVPRELHIQQQIRQKKIEYKNTSQKVSSVPQPD